MNYRMLIQYDGTKYNGWQRQGNTQNTIQGRIEAVLSRMTGTVVEVHGSGRTDAGVHANGQVANFKVVTSMSPEEIQAYLNQYLPEDIAVLELAEVDERFHSRLNAKSKIYRYRIHNNNVGNVFERKYSYQVTEPLNLEKMRESAAYFLGEHDFKSFCSLAKFKKSTIRTIYEINIQKEGSMVTVDINGNGFLYNMVRIIMGTLIEVGLNKREPDDIPRILEGQNREMAGATAPAHGLTLWNVFY